MVSFPVWQTWVFITFNTTGITGDGRDSQNNQ